MLNWFNVEANRAYVYRVAQAVIAILLAYGVISDEMAPLILGLVFSAFPVGLAIKNTTTKPPTYEGQMVVTANDEGKQTFSLELNVPPDELASHSTITFKVTDAPSS